jgi:Fe2+ transport system protein FeoA
MVSAGMPLTMATPGQRVRLVRVQGGQSSRQRLADLGLTPGVEMSVMQDSGGPLLVCMRDTRVALGRGLAHKVQVVDCEECPRSALPAETGGCCGAQRGGAR